jgi:hypothetical protein
MLYLIISILNPLPLFQFPTFGFHTRKVYLLQQHTNNLDFLTTNKSLVNMSNYDNTVSHYLAPHGVPVTTTI